MTDDEPHTCPICDTDITAATKRGPVTYVLHPCGHELDDHVYDDIFDE